MPESNIDKVLVPEWQKEQVKKRLQEIKKAPLKAIIWKDAVKKIKQLIK